MVWRLSYFDNVRSDKNHFNGLVTRSKTLVLNIQSLDGGINQKVSRMC